MALLGVTLPELDGRQVAIDVYPEQPKKKRARLSSSQSQEFIIVPLPRMDQRDLWEAFQRVINVSNATCWNAGIRRDLLDLAHEDITPPRNQFLYKAHYWPLDDLISDAQSSDLTGLFGAELNVQHPGFLLRLSFSVYKLFEQLMADLADYSAVIKGQLEASRCLVDSESPELWRYREFESQIII